MALHVAAIEEQGEFPTGEERLETRAPVAYLAIVEEGEEGWGAYLPDVPGVITTGETEQEVRRLIDEAVHFHLEGMAEDGEARPKPASKPHWVIT